MSLGAKIFIFEVALLNNEGCLDIDFHWIEKFCYFAFGYPVLVNLGIPP